ncbi:MAG TPA: HTH domain-containing protein [bacterium]|nr:HTH domain-containing protein [bacterium]HQI47404.1 HTH domain-containing protein [bacterium]HQJ63818.1 HTH domain-containing protein [bacterium]
MAEEMVSAGKLAKEWGVSETAVKKAIKELGVEPDAKKGACALYGKATAAKIKKALK